MMKNYVFLFLVFSMFHFGDAQTAESTEILSSTIEELSVFPNPSLNGKIYIITKKKLPKVVQIYDVLGKQIVVTTIQNTTLDISGLSPGIYILKITENKITATRKLVVR